MDRDDFLYLQNGIVVRKSAIRWLRKLDDCVQICANTSSCTPFSTYSACRKHDGETYEFLNAFVTPLPQVAPLPKNSG